MRCTKLQRFGGVAALVLLLAAVALPGALAHGSLTTPPARNVIQPISGTASPWQKDFGNGHGDPPAKPRLGPGVCGDPFQHSSDSSYYTRLSTLPIQATWVQGQVVDLSWFLSVNHGGRIGFKVCPRRTNLDQACFDANPLVREDNGHPFTYIMTGSSMGQLAMSARYRLPANVNCAGGCTLQWEYLTMNSCFEPCPREFCGVYADKVNPVTGGTNMADCWANIGGLDTVPEIFRNCADVVINTSGGSPPVVPPSPPVVPPSPPPTSPSPSPPGGCPPTQAQLSALCASNPSQQFFSDPCSCSNYVQCSNGVGYRMACGSGLNWDQANKVCNWPANAGCTVAGRK